MQLSSDWVLSVKLEKHVEGLSQSSLPMTLDDIYLLSMEAEGTLATQKVFPVALTLKSKASFALESCG